MNHRPMVAHVIGVVQVGCGGFHVLSTRHLGLIAVPGVFQEVGQQALRGIPFPEPCFVVTKGFGFVALVAFPFWILAPPLFERF